MFVLPPEGTLLSFIEAELKGAWGWLAFAKIIKAEVKKTKKNATLIYLLLSLMKI